MNAKDLQITLMAQEERIRIEEEFIEERQRLQEIETRREMRHEARAFMADMMDCEG